MSGALTLCVSAYMSRENGIGTNGAGDPPRSKRVVCDMCTYNVQLATVVG